MNLFVFYDDALTLDEHTRLELERLDHEMHGPQSSLDEARSERTDDFDPLLPTRGRTPEGNIARSVGQPLTGRVGPATGDVVSSACWSAPASPGVLPHREAA